MQDFRGFVEVCTGTVLSVIVGTSSNCIHVYAMATNGRRRCPGLNGKACIEPFPPLTKLELACIGCIRGVAQISGKHLERKMSNADYKEEKNKFKCLVRHQLHEGLSSRPEHLRGITDAIPLGRVLRLEESDFHAFHAVTLEAAGKQELTRLFDFVGEDGKTFVASHAHTARFQSYLTEGDFDGHSRTMSIANPIVNKIYLGLLQLQILLTTEVCALKDVRVRTPPAMGNQKTRWGEPMALFSKGAKERANASMPSSAFTNQALHCDFNPRIASANAAARRNGTPYKPVPYSVIINCSPEDAIIFGAGLSPQDDPIGIEEITGIET